MSVQSLDIISVNLWQILISLANLLIIYLILKKVLFAKRAGRNECPPESGNGNVRRGGQEPHRRRKHEAGI